MKHFKHRQFDTFDFDFIDRTLFCHKMEATYPIEQFPEVSEVINLKQYFRGYTGVLEGTLYREAAVLSSKTSGFAMIAHIMAKSESRVNMISERCRVNLLDPDEELTDPLDITETTADQESETSRKQANSRKLLEKASAYLATATCQKMEISNPHKYQMKLRKIRRASLHDFVVDKHPLPTLARIPKDFLLVARIYKPFLCNSDQQLVSQNCLLHSSNLLSELKDKIYCQNDNIDIGINRQHESQSSRITVNPMKNFFKSGMFYFGNTFYCDFRVNTNKDYSEVIAKWALENPQMNIGQFQRKRMEETRIEDLEIRLGFPYVYMHMGTCEHLIVFLDARLVTTEDPKDRDIYPIVDRVPRFPVYCFGCDMYMCKWIVEGDERIPQTPAAFCESCFRTFCYKDGQKVGSFNCYPYSQPEINVGDFSESTERRVI